MGARLIALLLLAAFLLPAKKITVATARGENEDLVLTVTLHIDPAEIKEMLGDDLGGHYIVADVKVEPKYGKDIALSRDDFLLRTDKDGDKASPYTGSQVAGRGLVVDEVPRTEGIASPGWTDTTVPVVKNPAAPGIKAAASGGGSPLVKELDSKILPEGKTDKAVSGLLYFPMEKQKMKDLELYYGDRDNRISIQFK
jgi:hypothetical protein